MKVLTPTKNPILIDVLQQLYKQIAIWHHFIDSSRFTSRYSNFDPTLAGNTAALVDWLERSWSIVAATLREWRVSDLSKTFAHEYWGKTYAVSYQWVIWRILTHDVQHGGEIALMLGIQGLPAPELGDLGGHLAEPPVIQG